VKANRLVLLAAGTAMLALTGCAPTANVAARVGDATVTTAEVDFLSRMRCIGLDKTAEDPSQAGNAQMAATAQIRTGMVNTLVQSELNRQLAARDHLTYDKATLRSVLQQYATLVEQVPAEDRDEFSEVLEGIFRGQLEVYTLAQSQFASQGVVNPTQDQVDQAVAAIQDKFRKTVDIEVNPQYGADDTGVAGAVDPSLSLAVSSFAKSSVSATPDATWVSKLPADQRCG